jgi:hypothetical protein
MPLPLTAALAAPLAPDTRSVMIALARTTEMSGRYTIPFQWPAEIRGFHLSVIANSAIGGLVQPTIADILVDLSVNEGRRYTSTVRDSNAAAGSGFCDLGAIGFQAPRSVSIPLAAPSELGIELRWKRWTGAVIYDDALVSISALYRRCTAEEIARLQAEAGPAD